MTTNSLRRRLVDDLVALGVLSSEGWRVAFNQVPREAFVPAFHWRPEGGTAYELVDGSDPAQRSRWLELVHDPGESLVTDVDPITNWPTSSSTMPRIVAAMLEALDVAPGQRVLEIGTGSGYSTALLCERLGSANVTSVDVDSDVVNRAASRLAALGYAPRLFAGDGFHGYAENAPYDRIIATCQVERVPMAWVRQARMGAGILVVLPDGMVRLVADGGGGADGHMHPYPVAFMWMRGHSPTRVAANDLVPLVRGAGETRRPSVDVMAVLRGEEIASLWPVALSSFLPYYVRVPAGPGGIGFVDLADSSWVRVRFDGSEVVQGGPRRLWDRIEELYQLLDRLGRPPRDRFGLTVRPDGGQSIWLDSPSSGVSWDLAGRQEHVDQIAS